MSEFFKEAKVYLPTVKDLFLQISDKIYFQKLKVKYKVFGKSFVICKDFDTVGTQYRIYEYKHDIMYSITNQKFCVIKFPDIYINSENYNVMVPDEVISFLDVAITSSKGNPVTVDYTLEHAHVSLTVVGWECV